MHPDVRFVPIADIGPLFDHLVGAASRVGGTVNPSALAVLRLMTSLKSVGA